MKQILFAIAFTLVASDALAINRYDITNMTCEQVQALLAAEGEAILRYGSSQLLGLPVYDRYVSGQQACESDELVRRTGVPTADRNYCVVRQCVDSSIFVAR